MPTTTTRLAVALTAMAIAGGAVPGASAQDLRSPDTRDAASYQPVQDLRSPDARDEAYYRPVQDLRSPDARDEAYYRPVQDLRSPDTVDSAIAGERVLDTSGTEVSTSGGFDWVSATIGAVAANGLLLVIVGFTLTRRALGRRTPAGA